jgi:hypothetical protein
VRLPRYRNNRSGIEELDHWLQSQGTVEQVVMESSGHYWLPLASRAGWQALICFAGVAHTEGPEGLAAVSPQALIRG